MKKSEKIEFAKKLKEDMKKYQTIGIANLFKFPTKALQNVRRELKDDLKIKVVKKSLLLRVLNEINEKDLEKIITNQLALIFSNEDPFKLFAKISKIKTQMFAKEGDIADEDILIKAGPTDLNPGPVISEFAKAKIPAGVEGGKIAIKKDTIVAKKGDKISKELASILRKLKIKPIKKSLEIVGIYSNGQLYSKEALDLVNEVPMLLMQAKQKALNLSIFILYPTKDNISFLLSKAYNYAKILEEKLEV